jgi:hypothetical protein
MRQKPTFVDCELTIGPRGPPWRISNSAASAVCQWLWVGWYSNTEAARSAWTS